MIPTIGIIIGMYIIAKMMWIIGIQGDFAASIITKIFCIIVIVVSIWGIFQLITSGSSIPTY